ncbi:MULTISPECIES: HlyD family secretion protein [unclassified Mesorhizobium]|uniref:efflux RND transporter periplasmic adaptor subunit n=1 Tax=unclassified Mesorhizobium TaxID=325217 RepID=UPI00112CD3E6|nr:MULTISPECIES: HlyD family secretion protein [unclassified Mesorhizobium]MBZ9894566.1 HlyD family secretion protein [Mesorhizobium sp. BR1-1-6]TPM57505.1 HlyD family secretion protein [Mesorhizobium sp. B2-2-4]TPM65692.1 HlyD family secretion protein [Mesorhizobium sp. B2-2-1]TPN38398.1 HlyD family secretion protein [Mesorhizobium sp. B1-1-6]TPN72017.1 HlyD family secretion protein [Mesorhizobium sp. B1-1-3]
MDGASQDKVIDREEPGSATLPGSTESDVSVGLSAVARAKSGGRQSCGPEISVAFATPPVGRRTNITQALLPISRRLATLAIFLVAAMISLVVWDQYVVAPWTRDGRVRVQVAGVAPRVSGQITKLWVSDNQFVHKGDVLYQIEPFDFDVALRLSKAVLEQKEADNYVKELQSERRKQLSELSISKEQQQIFEGSARQAKAAVDVAREQVAQAAVNLKRTEVRSPVNGYVTNLLLRVGDYAHEGVSNISIVDTDSFWVDGYFEETKLAQMCIGDRAEVKLMGYAAPLMGHVTTITRGVSVSNAAAGPQGLPNIDPVYTWVRLAQRVPVRIAIDRVPPGMPLVSGMTGTVTLRDGSQPDKKSWLLRVKRAVGTSLSHIVRGVAPEPGCIASKP